MSVLCAKINIIQNLNVVDFIIFQLNRILSIKKNLTSQNAQDFSLKDKSNYNQIEFCCKLKESKINIKNFCNNILVILIYKNSLSAKFISKS